MLFNNDGLGCICFKRTILRNIRTGIQEKLLTEEVSRVTIRKSIGILHSNSRNIAVLYGIFLPIGSI